MEITLNKRKLVLFHTEPVTQKRKNANLTSETSTENLIVR